MKQKWWQGLSRYQWLLLTVAWLGWVFDIMDTALFTFAKKPMLISMLGQDGYDTHGVWIEGALQSTLLIGWALGGLIFGLLADRWGRTRTLTLTILLYCGFTGLAAFCHTPEQMAVVRFLTGLGIGGEWAAGAALIAEAFPDRSRAPAAAILQSAAAVGPALAATINLVLPRLSTAGFIPAEDIWRWMFIVGVLPAAMTVVIRKGVKEPERWQKAVQEGQSPPRVTQITRHPVWGKHALIATILAVVGIAGAGNVSFWLPNLVDSVSAGISKEVISDRVSYATYTIHIGTMLGVLLFPALCERWGRKRAFLAFFILSPISVATVTHFADTYTKLLIMTPLMSFFTLGLTAGFGLYFPELFPTRLRATGAGLAYNVSRIFAAPMPAFTGWLVGGVKTTIGEGIARAALVYLIGVLAIPFGPETKGKSLPEE